MKYAMLTVVALLAIAGSVRTAGAAETATDEVRTITVDRLPEVSTEAAMTIVPEPTTLAVYAVGAIGLLVRNRRTAKA